MTTYEQFAQKTSSEKNVLVWIEPSERLLLFSLHSGAVYKKTVDFYVISVKQGSASLTEASSASLSAGEWYYDSAAGELYVRTTDDSDPKLKDISATYRLFFSALPASLPYDLLSGADVHYDERLMGNSDYSQELDEEQTGISIEGQGFVTLQNTDGFFDPLFDRLFFENKRVAAYSWSSLIPLSEKKVLFDGIIDKKSFTEKQVKFNLKDNMYQLRDRLNLTLFSASDGDLSDEHIGTPKRRIYGEVKQLQCIGIDKTLDGFDIAGTLAGTASAKTITGTGTSFLDECSPGDTLKIVLPTETIELGVDSVETDTSLTVSETISSTFTGSTATNEPAIPYRKKNRRWHISGDKLRAPTTTVSSASQLNRITVADSTDMFEGDLISVDGEDATIRRISGNLLVLEANLQNGLPSGGESVTKSPVSKAYFGSRELVVTRDWTLTNSTEAILEVDELAEFNVTKPLTLAGTITFTASDRSVTGSGTAFTSTLKPRDWIQSDDSGHTTWYEVLQINSDTDLDIRVAYAGSNNTGAASYRPVEYIDDESLILVNTIGKESSGAWVKTASDAVSDIITTDTNITAIDTASFATADANAPYKLSMVLPEDIGSDRPIIRDVINMINGSVFGSLTNDQDFNLRYQVLDAEKPTDLDAIEDDDIISFGIKSNTDIYNKVTVEYSPFVDRFSGESSTDVIEVTNTFVDKYIGTDREKVMSVYLFEQTDAQTIGERFAFFHSLSQSIVTVKTKLNLSTKNLNDKVYIALDRLYHRFAQGDRRKIGIISKIAKNGMDTLVEFNDLGNVFNRVPVVSEDTQADFTSSTSDDRIRYGWVVDDDLEVPDTTSENELGANLIG